MIDQVSDFVLIALVSILALTTYRLRYTQDDPIFNPQESTLFIHTLCSSSLTSCFPSRSHESHVPHSNYYPRLT